MPLIDMLVEYDEQKQMPYTLSILMELAEGDLHDLICEGQYEPLNFKQVFPVFRDSILGITFMHINNIAHRDIKSKNIMRINENKYVIADYGEGVNLKI